MSKVNKGKNCSLVLRGNAKTYNFLEKELTNYQRKLALNIVDQAYRLGYEQAKKDMQNLGPKKLNIYYENDDYEYVEFDDY